MKNIITAFIATDKVTSPMSVGFTINTTAVEGVDYTVVDNKTAFNFKPGVFKDEIKIMPINNNIADGDKLLTLTLSSNASGVTIGYPGKLGSGTKYAVTILDDDCPIIFNDMVGKWSGTDNWSPANGGPDPTQVETTYDGTNFTINGLGFGWLTNPAFWDEVVISSTPIIITDMDPITGIFTIPEQDLAHTTWNGAPQPFYRISGTGQYFPCTRTMVINYQIIQNGAPLYNFNFTETITLN